MSVETSKYHGCQLMVKVKAKVDVGEPKLLLTFSYQMTCSKVSHELKFSHVGFYVNASWRVVDPLWK